MSKEIIQLIPFLLLLVGLILIQLSICYFLLGWHRVVGLGRHASKERGAHHLDLGQIDTVVDCCLVLGWLVHLDEVLEELH